MSRIRIPRIILHVAATLLLSCGFVKAAEAFDELESESRLIPDPSSDSPALGTLPCGSNKRK
ncbi:MAG: hypothetical protein AB3N64_13940 [Puniceicoccaceae bacterium]